jgi:hypothetical protein
MLDEIVYNLERNDRVGKIKKLVFCACTNNWSNEAQNLSTAKFKSYLEQLRDRHQSMVELKYLLYRIVIRLNHSGDYHAIANTICKEMERLYIGAPTLTPQAHQPNAAQPLPSTGEMTGNVAIFTLEDVQAGTAIQVDLAVMSANQQLLVQTSVVLNGANQMFAQYQEWQNRYRRLDPHTQRLAADKPMMVAPEKVNDCLDAGALFQASLHQWYGSRAFQTIRDRIATTVSPETDLKIVTIARSKPLLRLPWQQIWQPLLERYPNAEVSLALTHTPSEKPDPDRYRVRVLCLLASAQGVKVDKSREFLDLLPQTESEFAIAPSYEQFLDLTESQSWSVLFFSSYISAYLPNNRIYINGDRSISLAEFKYRIQQALNRGLKMLILNCGDGVELASELADLPIPYTIVMREAVQDQVAQEFVKIFLKAFAGGKSVYGAVRKAREKFQAIEKVVPSASWLPIICHPVISAPMEWGKMSILQDSESPVIFDRQRPEADPTSLFMAPDTTANYEDPAIDRPIAPISYHHIVPGKRLSGYFSDVYSLQFSQDGKWLVSGHGDITFVDNAVKIWDLDRHQLTHNLLGHLQGVNSLCVTPDSQVAISASADGSLRWWEIVNGTDSSTQVNERAAINDLTMTEDGYTLVTGDKEGWLKIWNARDGQLLFSGKSQSLDITKVAIHTATQRIATASSDRTIALWELDGRLIRTISGHKNKISDLTISPDGKKIVSASHDLTIKIWDIETGSLLHQAIGHTKPIECIAISPDGQTLLSAGEDRAIYLWSLANGNLLHSISTQDRIVSSIAISDDGYTIATGSYGEIQLWQVLKGE